MGKFVEKTPEQIAALSPDELAAYNKEKEAAEKAADKAAKKETSEKNPAAGATQEHFQEQGQKSKENRTNGGEDVKVSLTNKTKVRFTADFGHMKKGHEQEVSDVALAIYEKAKVVEKI